MKHEFRHSHDIHRVGLASCFLAPQRSAQQKINFSDVRMHFMFHCCGPKAILCLAECVRLGCLGGRAIIYVKVEPMQTRSRH